MIKQKSIKYNFVFNLMRNLSSILFPMITLPYLSRVLMPEGIGKINFADQFVAYFVILASLGIPLYGTREIAKVRDDREKLNDVFNEIFIINICTSIIAYAVFFIFFFTSNKLEKEQLLFIIMSLNIIFITIGVDWFYQGIEKYDYITIRSIIVRIICLVLMFCFVKTKEDYIISAAITVAGNVGANFFNLIQARKYIEYNIFKKYNLRKHIKPVITIAFSTMAANIYLTLSTVMVGYLDKVNPDKAVGYYTISNKISTMIKTLIISLGVVLIPRLSYYIKNGMSDEYNRIAKKTINFLFLVSLPIVVGLMFLSNNVMIIFSGSKFIDAVPAMMIMTPIIIFSTLSNFFGQQILYSNGQEKKMLISVVAGAVLNIGMNLILIPMYSYIGAAISLLATEITVAVIRIYYGKQYVNVDLFGKNFSKSLISTIFMGIVVWILQKKIHTTVILSTAILVIAGVVVYVTMLTLTKEELFIEETTKLRKKLKL
jgi:O-antigen/teichoic acid export membrane protein